MSEKSKYIDTISNENIFIESENRSDHFILFVGGSGDTAVTWLGVMRRLTTLVDSNLLSFTFTGRGDGEDPVTLEQEVIDLARVCGNIRELNPNARISIVCTSQGAYSASWVSTTTVYSPIIDRVVYLDPADYFLHEHKRLGDDAATWDGNSEYHPQQPVASDMLRGPRGNLNQKIDVVNFTLANCANGGYGTSEYSDRGDHIEGGHSRLNDDMVEAFYVNTDLTNRGVYVEDDRLPHAFTRDGYNIQYQVILAQHLADIFNPQES